MTNASFTDTQAMVSTPLALSSSAFSMKPGRCLRLQVGVKAPGTANSTTYSRRERTAGRALSARPGPQKLRQAVKQVCLVVGLQGFRQRCYARSGRASRRGPCQPSGGRPRTFLPFVRVPSATSCMLPSALK